MQHEFSLILRESLGSVPSQFGLLDYPMMAHYHSSHANWHANAHCLSCRAFRKLRRLPRIAGRNWNRRDMIRTWAMPGYVEIKFPCMFGATVGVAIWIVLAVGELCMMLTKSPGVAEQYGPSLACAGRQPNKSVFFDFYLTTVSDSKDLVSWKGTQKQGGSSRALKNYGGFLSNLQPLESTFPPLLFLLLCSLFLPPFSFCLSSSPMTFSIQDCQEESSFSSPFFPLDY
ncbi:hypothetical protein VNO77_39031 [Canavalia gladiata]|uniref:Uncharacterized protein n=1 Tax=Canavalia gladiata TaxID=3824 RepID=A0AAN9KBH1_CANGL